MKTLRALRRILRGQPGADGLTVIRTVAAEVGVPRAEVSREVCHQVAHGKVHLDGDHRMWLR